MLYEFVTTYRDAIIARTRDRLTARPWPSASAVELDEGVPLFLSQLADTLKRETTTSPFPGDAIGASAARHGGQLLALGFTLAQVVHDYGDICQAVTEVALEQRAPITIEEFHTLNRCLDAAIAEAVTEHGRMTEARAITDEFERLGHVAHEIRDRLNTANLAFEMLKRGTVGINGSTGAVLGRTLIDLRDFVDSTLSEIRLTATQRRRERVRVTSFLGDLAAAGALHAAHRGLSFEFVPGDPELALSVDPQLLASAVTNLVNNACKYTPSGGRVVLRAHSDSTRLFIEVEDECGGIPGRVSDLFKPFGERRGRDRTGLGLGLSIARKAVRAHGGDIDVRNTPGKGCVFVIAVPHASHDHQ